MNLRLALGFLLSLSLASPALAGAPAKATKGAKPARASRPAVVPAGWTKTVSEDGGYSLVFPGSPQEQKLTKDDGTFLANMYVLELDSGNVAFMSSHSDLPKDRLSIAADTILEDAKKGAIANTKGTLESEKKVTVEGYPGRDIVIATPNGMLSYVRVVLAKGRLYQAMAVMTRDNGAKKDVPTYLNSFRLEKK